MTDSTKAASSVLTIFTRTIQGRFGRYFIIGSAALAVVAWVVAVTALLSKMATAKLVALFTVAGILTEVTLWSCAVFFGVSVFQKARNWFRRKDKLDHSSGQ